MYFDHTGLGYECITNCTVLENRTITCTKLFDQVQYKKLGLPTRKELSKIDFHISSTTPMAFSLGAYQKNYIYIVVTWLHAQAPHLSLTAEKNTGY